MALKGLYPTNLIFTTVFQADDGPKNAQNGVIRSKAELRKALRLQALSIEDKVDFEKEQLIFLALGECRSGHEAQINSVTFLTDRGRGLPSLTEVSYWEITVPGAIAEAEADPDLQPTYPMHVIKLKKLDGETTFNKN
jgi:hypothetical protein